jgi:hypothetical protein
VDNELFEKGFRCWWPISQRTVGPERVVLLAPSLYDDLSLPRRVEDLWIQHLVPKLAVEAFAVSILPGASRFDKESPDSYSSQPPSYCFCCKLRAMSDRMCSGGPCRTKRSARQFSTSSDARFLSTTRARHSRVNSSSTVKILIGRPLCVR